MVARSCTGEAAVNALRAAIRPCHVMTPATEESRATARGGGGGGGATPAPSPPPSPRLAACHRIIPPIFRAYFGAAGDISHDDWAGEFEADWR